jgi:hypothetical protein
MTRPLPRPEPTPTPTGDAQNEDPSALATRRAHEFEEDENDPFGPGGFGPINRKGPLDSPLGWVGLAGLIVALAFVALWAVERRRTGVRLAAQGLPAPVADKPRGKLQRALAIVARLSLRTWLGLLGLVEVILAGALVLALTLGQPASPYLPNTTAQAVVAWMAVLGLLELLLLLALASIWIYERYGLRGLSQSAQVYARLLRFTDWLHVRWRDSQTPHERGRAFAAAAPAAGELIGQIVDNYTREQYSPAPPDAADAEQLWQTTSPLLWVAGVRQRLQVIRRRWDDFVLWRDALSRRLNNQLG